MKIHTTSTYVHGLMGIVDIEETRLTKERDELEERLKNIKIDFEKKIEEIFTNIEGLNKKYETEYAREDACKEMEFLEH
jgi:hypothetical protein